MHTGENRGEQPAKGGSMDSEWVPENEFIPLFRWSARVVSLIVAGFFLFMFIGETFFGTRHGASPPIKPEALVGLALGGGYVIGLFLALKLKWERAGAILSGASGALLFFAIWRVGSRNHNPPEIAALLGIIMGLVLFLPVALYMLCWRLEHRDRKRYRAGL